MKSILLISVLCYFAYAKPMKSPAETGRLQIFDFTRIDSLDDWIEVADTARDVGKSKAAFVLQKTKIFQRAVLFTIINPQPNGAGFAGYETPIKLDLSQYKSIAIKHRGTGFNTTFKLYLRTSGRTGDSVIYEQNFEANTDLGYASLPLASFKPTFRGKPLEVEEVGALDTSDITSLGIQLFGGVYSSFKQRGVSALEIEEIVVY